MHNAPDKAFILAAGMGTRLRPHTDTMPKPMVEIAGTSIIKRTLAKLAETGVKDVVVNLHHLAPVMEAHLQSVSKPKILLSHEDSLLETGGGIKKALSYFQDKPFYIINGDALWDDAPQGTALSRLAKSWDADKMDILLLLQPVESMHMGGAVGDYHILGDGRAERAKNKDGKYMFAGIRIAHPRIFEDSPVGAFSFLSLMDKAQSQGRLYAIAHNSDWYHISTPEDLAAVNDHFLKRMM